MDHVEEARRVLFTRVQSFDSENAFKIMGYLLLQDWGEQDLLRIALGPEPVLYSIIAKAKKELGLVVSLPALSVGQPYPQDVIDDFPLSHTRTHVNSPSPISPFECKSPSSDSLFLAPSFRGFGISQPSSYCDVNEQWPPLPLPPYMYDKTPSPISHGFHEKLHNPRPNQFYTYKDHENFIHMQPKWVSTLPSAVDGNSPHYNNSLSSKPCLFFSRGYCKHGNNCRFLHAHDSEKNTPGLAFIDDAESTGSDDSFLSAVSFERLEQELRELLKGRQVPVSIASLPQLYYERFGKSLQAEGYLTESQRHGKAGFSLTKLLMRLKGIVTLIERPHGQHAVMLSEDALIFNEMRGYRDDYNSMNASSRQIYLTFPSESTFTEEDVTIHFRAYGPVQDVRIPYQQKRMFGFVTFVYSDTVRTILTEGNPHYICGARVLVKPYKEKGKVGDRKSQERNQFKHMPVNNHFPVRRYQRLEEQHAMNTPEDAKVTALEHSLGDLQLNESLKNRSSVPEDKSPHHGAAKQNDETLGSELDPIGDGCLSTDDGFSLQSSNFKYVLDLLEGESKDSEITDSAIMTVSRVDVKPQDVQYGNADITGSVANTMQMAKSHHLNSQNSRLMQQNWGAPTLFARSVF
ncbi:hypothetical protein GOP47_0000748 [Adiantum capillus-veneris]|uniref:Uncharacterized protein n=1 Tax=Adiantum capillus-veneris TaxID=13818 RepID=A0A9D4ZQT4_ADICA|nr:hypothetical protein GOP47_0000748 [Adiantum capillus-veneris]